MPAYKMLLHPTESRHSLLPGQLAGTLQEIGLLGAPRSLATGHYYPAGERFLELITFLGCSPSIELDPPTDPALLDAASAAGSFCHAFITASPPRLRADARTPAPRCPACKHSPEDWQDLLAQWLEQLPPVPWQCGACGHATDIERLPFRKTAGIASIWVEIRGIYPFEAIPGNVVTERLRSLSACPWRTIYLAE